MDADENLLVSRLMQNSINNAETLRRAVEGQKFLLQKLSNMETDRNFWKARCEDAEQKIRQLLIQQNQPIDKSSHTF